MDHQFNKFKFTKSKILQEFQVIVFDNKGRIVIAEFNVNRIELPRSAGIYYLKLITEEGEMIVKKILKKQV